MAMSRTSPHRHPQNRGRFGDGQDPRIDNIAAAAVARDGQRQDDIGIGIRGNRVARYAQCLNSSTPAPFNASKGWCRSCWSHR